MRNLNDNKGFSLMEILAAIIFILIALFAIMTLVVIVIKGNAQSNNITVATTIAQDKIEDMVRQGYANITDNNGTDTTYDNTDYCYYIDVEADTPTTNVKTVTVDVYWSVKWPDAEHQNWPGTNTTHNKIQLKTYLAE